ncbi:uncharacterized protein DFL_004925 [Arthrobotrys flagrans]|uniref:Uncharacterized protein n=1 Tax=Arthrobotrys flagrans TaxID=97331 RepID=A0A437A674_ARTFL|nr:hypothetical protein DFL_004925 [Arthrobotrys flagrans]
MIVLINGMIEEYLNRRVQIGIPKLVQEHPDSSMGASSTSSEGAPDEQEPAAISDISEIAKPPGRLPTAQP